MSTPQVDISALEKKIGLTFESSELATRIFVHRSYLNENKDLGIRSNERLEYLGDAVLELAVTEHLFGHFPDKPEGELTAIRSALVKRETLASVARELDLGAYLLFSKGETLQGGNQKDYILANTTEALLGALYLEFGYEKTRDVVEKFVLTQLPTILEEKAYIDSKSSLQEFVQDQFGVTPYYEVLSESGPDHNKSFEMGVYVSKELVGKGTGSSKRKAEERAALAALENKEWMKEIAPTEQEDAQG